MKKYYLLVVLIIIFFIFYQYRSNTDGSAAPIKLQSGMPDAEEQSLAVDRLDDDKPNGETEIAKPKEMPEVHWLRLKNEYEILSSSNRSISFFGLIVDQFGDPVSGAEISIRILGYPTSFEKFLEVGKKRGSDKFVVTSGADGRFSVRGSKGISLYVDEIVKAGYLRAGRFNDARSFVYSNLSAGESSSMFHFPDLRDPVVFSMWKSTGAEPLLVLGASAWFEGDDPKVQKGYFKLTPRAKPTANPTEGWDVLIEGENRRPVDGTWWFSITPNEGGGFIVNESAFTNLAPKAGYSKKLVFKSSDFEDGNMPFDRFFYFKGENGRKYGSFRMGFSGSRANSGFTIHFSDVKINPNGSRNLELNPAMIIRK